MLYLAGQSAQEYFLMKADVIKAFEWDFLLEVLRTAGFGNYFLGFIQATWATAN
jgi:hypothetical protein